MNSTDVNSAMRNVITGLKSFKTAVDFGDILMFTGHLLRMKQKYQRGCGVIFYVFLLKFSVFHCVCNFTSNSFKKQTGVKWAGHTVCIQGCETCLLYTSRCV